MKVNTGGPFSKLGLYALLLLLNAPEVFGSEATCTMSKSVKVVDPTYSKLAAATGGTVTNLGQADLGRTDILDAEFFLDVMGNTSHLMMTEGPAQDHVVYVDSTVSRLVFTVQTTNPTTFRLFHPRGDLVLGEEKGAERTQYSTGCRIRMSDVTPGTWRLESTSDGMVSIGVQGESAVTFSSFDFATRSSLPGHEGWISVQERPIAGQSLHSIAVVSGVDTVKSVAEFQLRSMDGELLAAYAPEEIGEGYYLLPAQPVPRKLTRIYVLGKDKHGYAYQRMFSNAVHGRDP